MALNKLDLTLGDMQNTRFENKYNDLVKQLSKQTRFTETELCCILMIYYKCVMANGPKAKTMSKKQFRNLCLILFKIYDASIIESIIVLITEAKVSIDPVAWVKLFSIYMSDKIEEKIQFCYDVYNMRSPVINKQTVSVAVQKFFKGDDEDEINELRSDMSDLIMDKFDLDKDGTITFEEYSTVVMEQPMLLECLGQCFPTRDGLTVIAYCANLLSKISTELIFDQ